MQQTRNISQGIRYNSPVKRTEYTKSVPIRNKTIKKATSISIPVNLSLMHTVFSFLVVAVMVYLYMVTSIVLATVNRKALEDTVRNETTELSYKETVYGQKIGDITLSRAHELGFQDSKESLFTTKYKEENLTLNN